MSIFGNGYRAVPDEDLNEGFEDLTHDLKNPDSLLEAFLIDDLSRMDSDQLQELCKPGGAIDAFVEAGILKSKNTIVRLSKKDDIERRRTMAAMQIARDKNDPLWAQLAKNRVKEKELLEKIVQKYGLQAEKTAKIGQKEYLKKKKLHFPASFKKAGGEDRVGN